MLASSNSRLWRRRYGCTEAGREAGSVVNERGFKFSCLDQNDFCVRGQQASRRLAMRTEETSAVPHTYKTFFASVQSVPLHQCKPPISALLPISSALAPAASRIALQSQPLQFPSLLSDCDSAACLFTSIDRSHADDAAVVSLGGVPHRDSKAQLGRSLRKHPISLISLVVSGPAPLHILDLPA